MNKSIILKINNPCIQKHGRVTKIFATLNAKNLAKLMNADRLNANPRESKVNKVTVAIQDTLKAFPENLKYLSKGLLISTETCETLDRDRFKLSFEDSSIEGVLDGGHNMLAVGIFMLEHFMMKSGCDDDQIRPQIKKIRTWEDFIQKWDENSNTQDQLDDLLFEMPVEIIFPSEDFQGDFRDIILSISSARNNNSQLTVGTQANHRGYYDILKDALDSEIANEVEWKDGEGKRIGRDAIVAMSLIPLRTFLDSKGINNPKISPVVLYSSKGKCVSTFSEIFEMYQDENGNVKDELFISAIKMIEKLPKLFDDIYKFFPDAYNAISPGFGRMNCVQTYEKDKKGKKYLSKPALTKYYKDSCKHKYPEGFIFPIFASLSKLMEVDGNQLRWKTDPEKFIKDKLQSIIRMYVHTIKDNGYNPNQVAKNASSYMAVDMAVEISMAN